MRCHHSRTCADDKAPSWMMLGAKGKKFWGKFILAIKYFSLTSLTLRSHWSELVTWPSPATVEQRSWLSLFPGKESGTLEKHTGRPRLPVRRFSRAGKYSVQNSWCLCIFLLASQWIGMSVPSSAENFLSGFTEEKVLSSFSSAWSYLIPTHSYEAEAISFLLQWWASIEKN